MNALLPESLRSGSCHDFVTDTSRLLWFDYGMSADPKMTPNSPPAPPDLASRIACDATMRVPFDHTTVVEPVAESLRAKGGWNAIIDSEELAIEAVGDLWDEQLAEQCARALAALHEDYLIQAQEVLRAAAALEQHGRAAWISQAIVFQIALRVAWDVLDREDDRV